MTDPRTSSSHAPSDAGDADVADRYTFLFTDIVASTEHWEQEPERMAEALARHDDVLDAAILAHGGERVKHTGDGVMAVFEDPPAAVAAAVEAQRILQEAHDGGGFVIATRMGLHCGPATKRRGDYFGTSPNRCARIANLAHGGQILISDDLARELRSVPDPELVIDPLGDHTLKGLSRPETIRQISAPGLRRQFPPLGGVRLLTELPRPTTALIGREDELDDVLRALEASSLVTLIGPGGVGKTRLAAHAAVSVRDAGVRTIGYVDLLPTYPSILDHTIAAALGAARAGDEHPHDALARHLRHSNAVLVLDNAEHVIPALSAFAEQLTARCPEVSLLITSQAPVGLPGERIVAVNPLDTKAGGPAYQLFVDRAAEVDPGFDPAGQKDAIVELCTMLDGLPLAVELAAARIRTLSAVEILDRLDHRLRFLRLPSGHPRARRGGGLGDVIAWSHELLDPIERTAFERLGVLRGPFDLASAEAVIGFDPLEDWEVADVLDRLVQRSLVTVERRGPITRYRMLESIAAFADEHLREGPDELVTRTRHANHYLALLAGLDPTDVDAADAFDLHSSNVRSAVGWALVHEREATTRLLLDRYRALVGLGFQEDAQAWYQMAAAADTEKTDPSRGLLLQRIGQLATATATGLAEGRAAMEESLAIARTSQDAARTVEVHLALATMLSLYPASLDLDAAAEHIAALEALIPEGSMPFVEARVHNCGAMLHLYRRESTQAVDRARRAGAAARAGGITVLEVNALAFEGVNLAYSGQVTEGLGLLEGAWSTAADAGFDFLASTAAWMRGYAAVLLADPLDAREWFTRELASGRPDAHPAVRRSLQANLGIALIMSGDIDGARSIAEDTVSINGTLLEPMLAFIRSGFDEADSATDARLDELERIGDRNEYAAVAYWSGRFDHIAGRRERAHRLLERALDIAVADPACPYYEVPVRAQLSMLGDAGHLDRAVEMVETTPLRGLEARVRLAQAMAEPPARIDVAEGRFSEALDIAARYGLSIDRVEILVRRADRRRAAGDDGGAAADVAEVSRLLASSPVEREWSHLTSGPR